MSITSARCFIIDVKTGERFQFQQAPTQIRDQKVANIKITSLPGASQPRIVPSGGGKRTISFTIRWFAESSEHSPEWVKKQIQFLNSLMYSRVVNEETGRRRVTPVFLILGTLLQLPCYIQRVFTAWGPFQDADLGPLVARTDIDFIEVDSDIFIDAISARAGLHTDRDIDSIETST